jgi:hypothetical protein
VPDARPRRKACGYVVHTDDSAWNRNLEAISMQIEPVRREPYESARRRVQVTRKRRPPEREPLDLRTPSGRVLPY